MEEVDEDEFVFEVVKLKSSLEKLDFFFLVFVYGVGVNLFYEWMVRCVWWLMCYLDYVLLLYIIFLYFGVFDGFFFVDELLLLKWIGVVWFLFGFLNFVYLFDYYVMLWLGIFVIIVDLLKL